MRGEKDLTLQPEVTASELLRFIWHALVLGPDQHLYTHPGQTPVTVTVLTQHWTVACVFPDGQDLPFQVPLKHMSFYP